MRNKGITLVALVITIIVLIILASVTFTLVLGPDGLIGKAQGGAEDYKKAAVNEQQQLDNINTIIDSILSETGSDLPTPAPKSTYSVGEVVTLGGEDFYVIEDSDESSTTLKLLAKYNVITTEGNSNRYKQDPNANTLRFNSTYSNNYSTSEIKTHADAYKLALEGRIGKAIQEIRLMSVSEVEALGGSSANHSTDACTGTTAFVNSTNYWLGTPQDSYPNREWYVWGDETLLDSGRWDTYNVLGSGANGLRPVIIILKSNI